MILQCRKEREEMGDDAELKVRKERLEKQQRAKDLEVCKADIVGLFNTFVELLYLLQHL